ncbi:hypothetical protein YT1_3968 [Rhodococcus ruber]|nr:hypothetical protein YT1_3968 [Rhodococcus ruber]
MVNRVTAQQACDDRLRPWSPHPRRNVMSDRDNSVVESDLIEESLVEEVSIDGMCGVY